MKGTRLWQETGSPLISGRSERERALWRDALIGWLLAVVASALLVAALTFALPEQSLTVAGGAVSGPLGGLLGGAVVAVVPAAVGAFAGAWLARRMGWRRPWRPGAAIGVLAALSWVAMSAIDVARGL